MPAPQGIGLAAGGITKKILSLAGIKDVWSSARGQTKTTLNTTSATFEALKNTSTMKVNMDQVKSCGIVAGKVDTREVQEQ